MSRPVNAAGFGRRAPLIVAIEARITPGVQGGVEQVAIGLAHGLSSLTDGDERYVFVTTEDDAWLRPHIGGQCELVNAPGSASQAGPSALATSYPRLARAWGRAKRLALTGSPEPTPAAPSVPDSDGTVERLGAAVVHFTMQAAYRTGLPSIYHPHDLQHLHLPEFFSAEAIAWRELNYRALCEQAEMVTVTTRWGRQDLLDNYRLPPDKVVVIPLAPAIATYEPLSAEASRAAFSGLGVSGPFAYYPAQTWPHKNHIRLVEALAEARGRLGVDVQVVCSGLLNDHHAAIVERARALGVQDLVRFVGFVEPAAVRALYQNARMLVFPTLFEAAGGFGPMFEAFEAGLPVATSSATSLREQAGDAALVFDPADVGEMAETIVRLWQDEELRATLAERARARVAQFTWDRVARTFRAHYRRLAGWPLTDEDRTLVEAETSF
jgi:glycosyltransferase involved in cell wall biosynthesis